VNESGDISVKRILFGGTGFLTVAFMLLALLLFESTSGDGGAGDGGGCGGNVGEGAEEGVGSGDAGVGEFDSKNKFLEVESVKTNASVEVEH